MSAEPAAARTLAGRLRRAWETGDDEEWIVSLDRYERAVDRDRLAREYGDVAAARAAFDRRYRAFVAGGATMAARVDDLTRLLDLALAAPGMDEPTEDLLRPGADYIALRAKLRRWEGSARRALLRALEVYRLLPDPERRAVAAEWGVFVDDRGRYPCWRRCIPVDRLDALDWRAHWFDAGSPYHGVSRQYLDVAGAFVRAATPTAWRRAEETARARGLDERRWGRYADAARDRLCDTGAWPRGTWPRMGVEQATFASEEG